MEPVLCYIDDHCAYFTTQELSKQWGDDWNDAPYNNNAGEPYLPHTTDIAEGVTWEISKVYFTTRMETPADLVHGGNSPYSVEMINNRHVAWLRDCKNEFPPIFAGTPYSEFIERIKAAGGEVYLKG